MATVRRGNSNGSSGSRAFRRTPNTRAVVAAVIGNALEWYDFVVFSFMTVAISQPYAAIGLGAPLIIVFARLLQGFSAGGEFGSATALLIEAAPFSRRGFYGSFQMASQAASLLLGAIVGSIITRNMSPEALMSWGWRVPFIFGLIIGPVGFYLRRNMLETEAFIHAQKMARRATLGEVFREHSREVMCGLGAVIALTVTGYVLIG